MDYNNGIALHISGFRLSARSILFIRGVTFIIGPKPVREKGHLSVRIWLREGWKLLGNVFLGVPLMYFVAFSLWSQSMSLLPINFGTNLVFLHETVPTPDDKTKSTVKHLNFNGQEYITDVEEDIVKTWQPKHLWSLTKRIRFCLHDFQLYAFHTITKNHFIEHILP